MGVSVGGIHEGGDIAVAEVPLIFRAVGGGIGEGSGVQGHGVGEVCYGIEIAREGYGTCAVAVVGVGDGYYECAACCGFYALGGGGGIP